MVELVRDLPLPYLALVLCSFLVGAVALVAMVTVLVECWVEHRHDNRTLADLDDEYVRIIERRRAR